MVRAGSLRDACELQTQTNTESGEAACDVLHTTFATVACSIANVSPFARLQTRGYTDALTHKFTIRWRPDVDISTYVLWRNDRYGVAQITDVNLKRQYFELYCYIIAEDGEFQNPSPDEGNDYFGGEF